MAFSEIYPSSFQLEVFIFWKHWSVSSFSSPAVMTIVIPHLRFENSATPRPAITIAETPPFISLAPLPYILPPSISPLNGSLVQRVAPRGTVSICPVKQIVVPYHYYPVFENRESVQYCFRRGFFGLNFLYLQRILETEDF